MRHLADRQDRQADWGTNKQAERQTTTQAYGERRRRQNDKNGVATKMTKITIAFCVLSYVTQRNSYDFIIILLRVFLRAKQQQQQTLNA